MEEILRFFSCFVEFVTFRAAVSLSLTSGDNSKSAYLRKLKKIWDRED